MPNPRDTHAGQADILPFSIRTPAEREPLYVEVGPMCSPPLTGIGRFAARLVESLSQLSPLRLVTTVQDDQPCWRFAELRCGREIVVQPGELPPADGDLVTWTRSLLKRPSVPHDAGLARNCTGLFTMLRPAEKHFRRELCILYDFTPLIVNWAHTSLVQAKFGAFFGKNLGLCDKAVAISQATKADASWLCPMPNENVVVGYPGPSLCVHAHAHAAPVNRSRNIILVVSTLEPRKNGRFLLDWFPNTTVFESEMELWWVGPKGWMCDLSHQTGRGKRHRRIRFLGMVSDQRLCELYRHAAFTIYPSLYEGFGFPVLDSLRHGAPVVSSFNSSLQEFGGTGVFYFDACDKQSLDEACRQTLAAIAVPGRLIIDQSDLDRRFAWSGLARAVLGLCQQPAA